MLHAGDVIDIHMEILVDGQRGDNGVYWAEDVNDSGIPIITDNIPHEEMCTPEYHPILDSLPCADFSENSGSSYYYRETSEFRPPFAYLLPNGNSSLYNPAIGPNTSYDDCELSDNERVTVIVADIEAGDTGYVITDEDVMLQKCNWGIDVPAMRIDPERFSCGQKISVEIGLMNQKDYGGIMIYPIGCSFVIPVGTLCCPFDIEDKVGRLTVSIDPPEAITAGAQWRMDDGTWHNNKDTLCGLTPGTHTVTFKSIAGWEKPENKQVNISGGQTTQAYGIYIEKDIQTMPMPWLQLLLD